MRKHGMPEAHAAHPNVTPLIDVVMCLIIFYMLVAKIGVARGVDPAITLPASVQGLDIKDMGNTLILNVDERGGEPLVTALFPSAAAMAKSGATSASSIRPLASMTCATCSNGAATATTSNPAAAGATQTTTTSRSSSAAMPRT